MSYEKLLKATDKNGKRIAVTVRKVGGIVTVVSGVIPGLASVKSEYVTNGKIIMKTPVAGYAKAMENLEAFLVKEKKSGSKGAGLRKKIKPRRSEATSSTGEVAAADRKGDD